jgi:hypothetical protein
MESSAAIEGLRAMTRAAKITYLGALLLGLSIGSYFSFRTATHNLEAFYDLRRLAAPQVLRDFSYLQYKYSDPEHAKAALLTFASLLEQMEKTSPEKARKLDLAYAYTRLALLEDAANNREQSRYYMTKTRLWYRSIDGRDISDYEMKVVVDKMDAWMQ